MSGPARLSIREQFHPIIWLLLWPVRAWIRWFPIGRGKGLLLRWLVVPLLPADPAEFAAPVGRGGVVGLRYRERIGLSTLLGGPFEGAEVSCAEAHASRGGLLIDVGANVGVFTVAMARAVGDAGRVLAFEPCAESAQRLAQNTALNGLDNVDIRQMALGDTEGMISLHVPPDPAFASTRSVASSCGTSTAQLVRVTTLDAVWEASGFPDVTLVKIDVEGAELEVLRGADRMIDRTRPVLLVEANTRPALEKLSEWLVARKYAEQARPDFKPWNHLFLPGRA